jgi:hypothetical protein
MGNYFYSSGCKSKQRTFYSSCTFSVFRTGSSKCFFYFQPDFASSPVTGIQNFVQIRDLYFDLSFDKKKEYRLRVGQSKIPYGFENMQSSSQRLTLDSADGINSAIANERDLGIFFYWAPAEIRERFAMLVKDGYKGSGDFGVFAFGVYNGQTCK